VGRTTIRLVLGKLTALGLIEAQHGRGYFVPGPARNGGCPSPGKADSLRWQVCGERTLYEKRPWVSLNEHHVIRLFPAAIGIVVDDEDRVLMLWRHRFVFDEWGWEVPGGIVDDGEDEAVAVARQVGEETGWRLNEMRPVISYQPMIGMVDSLHALFYAKGGSSPAHLQRQTRQGNRMDSAHSYQGSTNGRQDSRIRVDRGPTAYTCLRPSWHQAT
jgi:hypothetical protein